MDFRKKAVKRLPGRLPWRKSVDETIWKEGAGMDDLKKYIGKRKKTDPDFANNYQAGYEKFKIGVLLRQAREESGLTQEELAHKLKTKKSAISRIENHAEDIKLSTIERVAIALNKKLLIELS